MVRTTISRTIDAPIEKVFDTVANIENYSRAIPKIIKVEFLTDQHSGVGTRFRETRRMGKREVSTELEVTEYVRNERIRLVSDAGGTTWDTVFTTRPASGGGAELNLEMTAEAHKFMARILNPLIRGMVQRLIESDLDSVKAYCEGSATARPVPTP